MAITHGNPTVSGPKSILSLTHSLRQICSTIDAMSHYAPLNLN